MIMTSKLALSLLSLPLLQIPIFGNDMLGTVIYFVALILLYGLLMTLSKVFAYLTARFQPATVAEVAFFSLFLKACRSYLGAKLGPKLALRQDQLLIEAGYLVTRTLDDWISSLEHKDTDELDSMEKHLDKV